jgi:hypothetical protein
MLFAMFGSMLAGHSALRDLASMGLLIATSIAYAPRSRTDVAFREHLVDLWVMALVLLACLPGHQGAEGGGAHTVHDHFSLPGGPALVCVALAAWIAARIVLARRGARGVGRSGGVARGWGVRGRDFVRGWSRTSLVSAALVAASVALMLAFCAPPP